MGGLALLPTSVRRVYPKLTFLRSDNPSQVANSAQLRGAALHALNGFGGFPSAALWQRTAWHCAAAWRLRLSCAGAPPLCVVVVRP